ncbi:uncharacterized protein [Periplaneta americana]|uniref:uncharacterized protein n=1 Tax=Periplaneta americana TaxID=6978 RepID=UPI0037E8831F
MTAILTVVAFASTVLSAQPDIVFERETSSQFSAAQLECFKRKQVLYKPDGQCYKLLETGPCKGEHQWLVLDTRNPESLDPVCRQCPCCDKPYRAVYWPSDGQCHHFHRDSKALCPLPGNKLTTDPFGDGECACDKDPPHARISPDLVEGVCYPLYRRGPCGEDRIFVPSINSTSCEKDPCAHKGEGYVKWSGTCYELGSQGPCNGSSTFIIHPVTRRPSCLNRVNQIVDLPPTCDTDQNGNCRPEVTLPTNGQYLDDLIAAAKKNRAKRRVYH